MILIVAKDRSFQDSGFGYFLIVSLIYGL